MNFDPNQPVDDSQIPLADLLVVDEDEAAGIASLSATEEEFDAIAKGELFLGELSARVVEPDYARRTDYKVAEAELAKCSSEADRERETQTAEDYFNSPPETEIQQVVRRVLQAPEGQLLKKVLSSAYVKMPKCCAPSMIRCGENTARVEQTGSFVMEYDADGNLLRGYSVED